MTEGIKINSKKDIQIITKVFTSLNDICGNYSKDLTKQEYVYIHELSEYISILEKFMEILNKLKTNYEPRMGIQEGAYEYLKEMGKDCHSIDIIKALVLRGFKSKSKSISFEDTVRTALLRDSRIEKTGKATWKAIVENKDE